MAATWNHPTLGRFEFAGSAWRAVVKVPAFKAFSYDTGYPNAPRSTGKHALVFVADSEKKAPRATEVKLALTLLENQKGVADAIALALWDEFNGRGPTSGMWWYDGLNQIAETMDDDQPRPAGPDDVKRLLQVESVAVLDKYWGYPKPVIMITFHAAFEQEHDVSILTDGKSVLGTGYALEPGLYKPARRGK